MTITDSFDDILHHGRARSMIREPPMMGHLQLAVSRADLSDAGGA